MSIINHKKKTFWQKFTDAFQPFVIGGLSGCFATVCGHPSDLITVRMQLKSEKLGASRDSYISALKIYKKVYREIGIFGFYRGLGSSLTRQIFYATSRLGIYKTMFEQFKKRNNGINPSFSQKLISGLLAGMVGSFVSNPADLALVRMQADTQLPLKQRRNYKNMFDAFNRIYTDEGFFKLWRGGIPFLMKNIIMNFTMLATYDELKEKLATKDTSKLCAATLAGLFSAICTCPFDNLKIKIQNKKFPYKNLRDAFNKTIDREGFEALWIGLPPYSMRITRQAVILLLTQDKLTEKIKKNKKY